MENNLLWTSLSLVTTINPAGWVVSPTPSYSTELGECVSWFLAVEFLYDGLETNVRDRHFDFRVSKFIAAREHPTSPAAAFRLLR